MDALIRSSIELIRKNLAEPGEVDIVVKFINAHADYMRTNRAVHYALDDLVHFLGDQDVCEKDSRYDKYMREKLTDQLSDLEALLVPPDKP